MITAADSLQAMIRYLGGQVEGNVVQDAKEAVVDGLLQLWAEYDWPWYYLQDSIQLNAPYTTGTITYVASTKQATLSGGTWPDWAIYGSLRVGALDSKVKKRNSATVITLENNTAFIDDISSASTYQFYRNEYPFPGDARKVGNVYLERTSVFPLEYLPPMEFKVRRSGVGTALPLYFTVMRDRFIEGALVIAVWPYPGIHYSLRFNAMRSPSTPRVWDETTGKVSVTGSGTTVTGTNTVFDANLHEGCVIRIGRDATNIPTSYEGQYPRSDETIIDSVTSATALEGTSAFTYSRSTVRYQISSLIDIDPVYREAFFQRCLVSLASRRGYDPQKTGIIRSGYRDALYSAKSAASPSNDVKYAGSFLQRMSIPWITLHL